MIKRQDRRYARVEIERPCIIVMTDEKGFSTTYLSKSINLSACGVLLHELETMLSDKIVDVKMSIYDCYHIVIFLEKDMVLKQFARFVREERRKGIHGYAFQFMSMSQENTEVICQYIDQEIIRQMKLVPAQQ